MTDDPHMTDVPDEAVEFELRRLIRFYSRHMPAEQLRESMDALREKARDQAVGVAALAREAERRAEPVSDAEMEEQLRHIAEECGGEAQLDKLLGSRRLSRDHLRISVIKSVRVDKLIKEITAGVEEPTEDDIRAYHEENPAQYLRPERALLQHILVKPESDSEEARSAALERLMEIQRELEEGEDFADLAAAHSDCPSGRKTGGSLGWVPRGTMLPEFEKAAFEGEEGGSGNVVKTPLGFHLVRKLDHEEERPAMLDEARDAIREFLLHARRGKAIADYVARLQAKEP